MRTGYALWIALVLLVSCADRKPGRCRRAADHVADLLVADAVAHPGELWDGVHANPGETGIPASYTKDTFGAFLASTEGKAWIAMRRANAQRGTAKTIEQCVARASDAQIDCMLAAKTRADVTACDNVK